MSDKQKPVVHLAMDAEMESEFRAMERLGQLVQWLDEVSTPTAQAELKNIIPSIEWSSLSLKTVDGFIATASSQPELVNALNTWKSLREQREARARLEAEYAEKLSTRRQGMESALELKPDAPFNFRTNSSNQLIEVELLHSMGIVMHHELPRPPDNLQPPDPLELRTEKIAIQIHGPKIYQSQFGQRSQVSILGNEGRIALITTQEKQADLYLLASIEDPQLLLDFHALPDGSQSRRYIALKGDNWKAEVRLGEDPRLLFDRLYFEDLSKALRRVSLTSITVTGSQRAQFELDDLLALLFFATGHEFRKLEVQELADDQTIVSVTIPSSRPRQLVGHGYRLKDMVESSDMHEAFICLQRLPARARHFSRYHFRVLIHAMQVALQSPVQKTLIDLYQILDTVAGLHPKVSKTKEPQEAFDLRKQQQKVIVNAAQAIIKALKLIQSSEDVPVADALKGFEEIVHYQKNEPEAAKRIGMLLQAVGLPYSKGDKTAKKAIVSAAQAIIKAFKLIQSSEGVSAADALKGLEELINYQKNEPGVARRIRMLLLAVNLPYSEGDKTAKLALDLRNSISHDLASVRVKGDPDDDGYPLGDLLDVQGRLLMWAHLSLSNLLWMAREPAGATTAAPVSTEEPAASEDLKGK